MKYIRPLTECFMEVLSRLKGELGSKSFAPYSLEGTGTNAYLCHTDYNAQELLNSFSNPVQRIGGKDKKGEIPIDATQDIKTVLSLIIEMCKTKK